MDFLWRTCSFLGSFARKTSLECAVFARSFVCLGTTCHPLAHCSKLSTSSYLWKSRFSASRTFQTPTFPHLRADGFKQAFFFVGVRLFEFLSTFPQQLQMPFLTSFPQVWKSVWKSGFSTLVCRALPCAFFRGKTFEKVFPHPFKTFTESVIVPSFVGRTLLFRLWFGGVKVL